MTQRYFSTVKDVQIEQLAFSNGRRACVCFVIGKRACHVIQTHAHLARIPRTDGAFIG